MGDTFHGVIAFALLGSMLLLGTVLRSRLQLLQRTLIPASVVGGLIGFALLSLGLLPGFAPGDFSAITFHVFTLSFMSLCLTGASKERELSGGSVIRGGLWLTIIWTVSLGFQGVLGLGVFLGYDAVTGSEISPWLGAIITHGFTQGPGQALTYGTIWEKDFGIGDAAQIGIIYASLGFLMAFLVGVPLARHFIGRGLNLNRQSRIDEHFVSGFFRNAEQPVAARNVTHPANLDSLAYHLGLLGAAYVITYAWLNLMQPLVADVKPFGISLSVLFSYNMFFIHGVLVAVLMRFGIDRLGLARYVDDETVKRITGSSVDFTVVGTLMSIKFAVLYAFLLPILLITVVITLFTLALCLVLGKLSGRLGYERAVTAFGCCCGSTGTGLLLLRMMDANFATSVPKELAFFNLAIILVNIHLLTIFAPIAPSMSIAAYVAIFGGTSLVALAAGGLLLRKRPAAAGGALAAEA